MLPSKSPKMEHNSDVQLGILGQKIEHLTKLVESLESDVREMKQTADRWKGGFLVIVGLGGVLTWILNAWDKIK